MNFNIQRLTPQNSPQSSLIFSELKWDFELGEDPFSHSFGQEHGKDFIKISSQLRLGKSLQYQISEKYHDLVLWDSKKLYS